MFAVDLKRIFSTQLKKVAVIFRACAVFTELTVRFLLSMRLHHFSDVSSSQCASSNENFGFPIGNNSKGHHIVAGPYQQSGSVFSELNAPLVLLMSHIASVNKLKFWVAAIRISPTARVNGTP